jgi:hypothetical protein
LNKEVTVRFGKLKMQLWDSGAVGKDCQRRLLSRSRFVRAVAPRIIIIIIINERGAYEVTVCEISSSHGGEYEAQNLLGCTAVFLIEYRPTFQKYVLPPSSGR